MINLLRNFIFLSFSSLLFFNSAFASDLENLCKKGYGVVMEATVVDDFKGCEFGKVINFDNGLGLKCTSYSYHYSYRPEVMILKSVKTGAYKVIIDDEEFDGDLVRLR